MNNRAKRIQRLKGIIIGLHEGVAEDEVRQQLRERVRRRAVGQDGESEERFEGQVRQVRARSWSRGRCGKSK